MICFPTHALRLQLLGLSSCIGQIFIINFSAGDNDILSRPRNSRSWFVLLLGFVGRVGWQYHGRLRNCNILMSSGAALSVPAGCADGIRTVNASVKDGSVMPGTLFALGRMCNDLSERPMFP